MRFPGRSRTNKAQLRAGGVSSWTLSAVTLINIMVLFAGECLGQLQKLPPAPLPVDPTPLSDLLTAAERTQLAQEHNPKKLIEAYLKISDAHLAAADKAIGAHDPDTAERELDIFNKASDKAATEAFSPENKKRRLGKIVEQRLYAQLMILESIERRFPPDLVGYPDAALANTTKLHNTALNETLASGKVITGKSHKDDEETHESPPPETRPRNSGGGSQDRFLAYALVTPGVQMAGDYMTEKEEDDVREAQEIDLRTKVFIRIADRRLAIITGKSDEDKESKKKDATGSEVDKLATRNPADLLRQYYEAISELEDKLDDANQRNPKSSALKKALVTLHDGTSAQLEILHSLQSQMKTKQETGALKDAIEKAEEANKGAGSGLKTR
ncbi:MAG TPA: hypothetical protein VJX67_14150 [Blastocatellia bacterium]|nr:hypothetical protein [Blastocatellia bacterium]